MGRACCSSSAWTATEARVPWRSVLQAKAVLVEEAIPLPCSYVDAALVVDALLARVRQTGNNGGVGGGWVWAAGARGVWSAGSEQRERRRGGGVADEAMAPPQAEPPSCAPAQKSAPPSGAALLHPKANFGRSTAGALSRSSSCGIAIAASLPRCPRCLAASLPSLPPSLPPADGRRLRLAPTTTATRARERDRERSRDIKRTSVTTATLSCVRASS